MRKLLRRLLYGKKKYYHNRYRKVGWSQINDLNDEIYKLRSQVTGLANSLDRECIGGVYMPSKEAKKYRKQDGFICR